MPMQESSTSESDDGAGDPASADDDIFATVVPGGDNGGGLALDPGAAHSNEPMPPLPAEAVPGGDGHPREQPVVVPPPPPAPLPPVPLSAARASAAGSQAGDFGPREEAEATVSFAEGKITFYRKGTRFQAQCFLHGPSCRLSRTGKPPAVGSSRRGQGRPVGLMSAWLQIGAQPELTDKVDHCATLLVVGITRAQRVEGRNRVRTATGGLATMQGERPKAEGEDSEPDEVPPPHFR